MRSEMACLLALTALTACKGNPTDSSGGAAATLYDGPLLYAPAQEWSAFRFQDRPVRAYIPPDPVGMVWMFHGTNGNISMCHQIEPIATINELVLAGIGFACSESLAQGQGNQWDDGTAPDDNPDVAFLDALHDELVATTPLTDDTPQFTLGFSAGGGMAGFYADYLISKGYEVPAVAPHNSNGYGFELVEAGFIYILPENDPQGRSTAEASVEGRTAAGFRTEILTPPEVPLNEAFFGRDPNLQENTIRNTLRELERLELIDEAGHRLFDIDDHEDMIRYFENNAEVPSPTNRTEQMRVGWATHRLNGIYARDVRDFFLDHLE